MRKSQKTVPSNFGHPPQVLAFWRRLVRDALAAGTATPFYLFSADPIAEALAELRVLGPEAGRATLPRGFEGEEQPHSNAALPPIRHWLSCKTQPVAPLLRWWRKQGRPIEVVSEFEYLAARHEGFLTDDILINGPAKHRWLPRVAAPGLRVNFDSPGELKALLPHAKKLRWRVGLRLRSSIEHDPENPEFPTQFGFEPPEAAEALKRMKRAGVVPETLHFHLRTNVEHAGIYEKPLLEALLFCQATNWWPSFLDCGGGLPPRHTFSHDGKEFAGLWRTRDPRSQNPSDTTLRLESLAGVFRRWLPRFAGLRELWLENGRFVSARSGVLVVTVVDVKERDDLRQLICDGGRTMHALVSTWEEHGLFSLPTRGGALALTAVHGPTCMAFDQLTRRPLPRRIRRGDQLVWMEAGAYQIPWETRFSHGLAAVLWHESGKIKKVRAAEKFSDWWDQWDQVRP
jgi:diaminopimelate decarboxylase